MSNESMLPRKLSRHLKSEHPHLKEKDLSYFKRLLEQNRKQASIFKSKMTVSEKAQIASLEISEMIAQNLKSHTLGELIILPACRKMVKTMLGDEAEKEIKKIRGAFNKFPDFFVQAFIIAVNSRYFSILLLYSL